MHAQSEAERAILAAQILSPGNGERASALFRLALLVLLPRTFSIFLSLLSSFSLPHPNPFHHHHSQLTAYLCLFSPRYPSPCSLLVSPSASSRSAPSPLLPARCVQLSSTFSSFLTTELLCCSAQLAPKTPKELLANPTAPSQQASKVTVLGAAGGIGQPLSALLKLNPRVSQLALYDIRGGPGICDSSPTAPIRRVSPDRSQLTNAPFSPQVSLPI